MPPTRRRPPANQPPARRPKVAGLRRPGSEHDQPADQHTEQHPERPEELTQRIERVRDEPTTTASSPSRPKPAPAPRDETPENNTDDSADAVWTEPEKAEPEKAEQPKARHSAYTSGLAARRAARAPEPSVDEPEPTTELGADLAADEPADEVPDEAKPTRRPARTTVLVALGAVTVVFGGLAAWFGVTDHNLTSGVVGGNTALTDTAATSQISGQVTSAINTMFSYDYQNLDKTKTAVQKLLVGNAISQYNQLFKTVEQQAPQQKLVLTTAVVDTGVKMIQGDKASVLVFANQTDVRASDNSKAAGGTMFSVEVVQQNGQWKISNIDTFNSTS